MKHTLIQVILIFAFIFIIHYKYLQLKLSKTILHKPKMLQEVGTGKAYHIFITAA